MFAILKYIYDFHFMFSDSYFQILQTQKEPMQRKLFSTSLTINILDYVLKLLCDFRKYSVILWIAPGTHNFNVCVIYIVILI
jgi:hypothetical protein